MYQHILLPTDGSELSDKAVRHGIALAKALGASITAVTVTEPYHVITATPAMLEENAATYGKRVKDYAGKILDGVANAARIAGVPYETQVVEDDQPYRAIIDLAAKKRCDLILMASHGRHGVAALVLGSETTKVLTHSKIPVLVYR